MSTRWTIWSLGIGHWSFSILVPIELLAQQPALGLAWVAAIVIAITVHEFAHAFIGDRLGDGTARSLGRLTLNPLAHVDVFGFLMLLLVGFGWGKPVPFDPLNLRNRRWGSVAIAFAGPFANLLGIIVSGLALRFIGQYGLLPANNLFVFFLAFSFQFHIVLMLFNLIPIPPLDGSKFLLALLDHPRFDRLHAALETRGPILLLAIIVIDGFTNGAIFGRAFQGVLHWAFRLF